MDAGEPYNGPSALWSGYQEQWDKFFVVKHDGRSRGLDYSLPELSSILNDSVTLAALRLIVVLLDQDRN